jgi:hypothetical protein
MKRKLKYLAGAVTILLASANAEVWADASVITIGSPLEGADITFDCSLYTSTTVTVSGTQVHDNVAGGRVCVSSNFPNSKNCSYYTGTGRPPTSWNYSIPVQVGVGANQPLNAVGDKGTDGDAHTGSATVHVNVSCSNLACDEQDPPAHANLYMNNLPTTLTPSQFAQVRGDVINQIAHATENGKYGSCTYDYSCVENDVDYALSGGEVDINGSCQ